MITVRVNGRPAPQGSKRHVGGGRMVEMSKAVGPWREAVRSEIQHTDPARGTGGEGVNQPLHDGPVSVTLVFSFARPASHYGRRGGQPYLKDSAPPFPAGRPDIDKLARACLDGIVMGGAIADDAQVCELVCCKCWCADGQVPGVLITITEMK